MKAKVRRPFCDSDPAAVAAYSAWEKRLAALGIGLQESHGYVIGLLASREVRLEQLAHALAGELDGAVQLRLVAAERLAAQDMARALDQAERVFGASVAEGAVEERKVVNATGPDGRVRAFASKGGLSPVAQRIAATVSKTSRPFTKGALRRRVPGSEDDFLRGLREAVAVGAVVRSGLGRKGHPFLYARGGA